MIRPSSRSRSGVRIAYRAMSSRYFLRTLESSSGRRRWLTESDYALHRTRRGGSSAGPENDGAPRADRERLRRFPAAGRVFGRDRANGVHEAADFAFHALQPRLQLQDDLHSRQVHTQLARERENDLEAFDRLEIVKARIAGGAGRPDEALTLGEAQRLRVGSQAPRDHADEDVSVPRSRGWFGARRVRPGPLATRVHLATLFLLLHHLRVDDVVGRPGWGRIAGRLAAPARGGTRRGRLVKRLGDLVAGLLQIVSRLLQHLGIARARLEDLLRVGNRRLDGLLLRLRHLFAALVHELLRRIDERVERV